MSSGYSLRLRDLNLKADIRRVGVELGRLCIEYDIPVTVVAKSMKVSRATVYNWFGGVSEPSIAVAPLIMQYISKLK